MFWYPKAWTAAIDTSSLIWKNSHFYVSPFSIIDQTLAKITWNRTRAVDVVPDLSTKYWHSQLLHMAMEDLKQHQIDTQLVSQITQTISSKGNSTANMVWKHHWENLPTTNVLVLLNGGWYRLKILTTVKFIV